MDITIIIGMLQWKTNKNVLTQSVDDGEYFLNICGLKDTWYPGLLPRWRLASIFKAMPWHNHRSRSTMCV